MQVAASEYVRIVWRGEGLDALLSHSKTLLIVDPYACKCVFERPSSTLGNASACTLSAFSPACVSLVPSSRPSSFAVLQS